MRLQTRSFDSENGHTYNGNGRTIRVSQNDDGQSSCLARPTGGDDRGSWARTTPASVGNGIKTIWITLGFFFSQLENSPTLPSAPGGTGRPGYLQHPLGMWRDSLISSDVVDDRNAIRPKWIATVRVVCRASENQSRQRAWRQTPRLHDKCARPSLTLAIVSPTPPPLRGGFCPSARSFCVRDFPRNVELFRFSDRRQRR